MEKISVSAFLFLVALSYTLAKDITVKSGAKKDTKDSAPKLPQTLSRGWGDQLIWTQTYEEALYKSKTSNKPLMIIHHLDECPHSQALKKVFAENKEIQKLAEQFVLLNLVYETTDKHLSPDGQYVPRIMFVDPFRGLSSGFIIKCAMGALSLPAEHKDPQETSQKRLDNPSPSDLPKGTAGPD
ncbi:anterior gradient protein 2 homolog isoform X1 [Herpailurus yagouaroundi]|uniref:anterior gradient protein 2 homolog isoform X1 n=1 Tax=Herpailurus yagouaroundi TaxID=1608482 RepID=UPI001AD749A6|nr:anterior gradient protein 2 homolog isoform X1 [Puma yagouaroundi]XP_040328445.1 anterior gradient protein 2 homolog isoform X1 [Puma yagouaroundi]XP_040328446.1 anterior gradient protein 2 homolog isoform X1 [Puma yagouaroundi]XP_040328447.1 anterior gradient protein 2 homolog isoform X1 [Puma yagouaroundi]